MPCGCGVWATNCRVSEGASEWDAAADVHAGAQALTELVEALRPAVVDADVFRASNMRTPLPRIFGGQVLGQALAAAGATVAGDRPVHSLHAYFLRPGDPARPLELSVERLRDGRSFSVRRVHACQGDAEILSMTASFHHGQPGFEHAPVMPTVSAPDALPSLAESLAASRGRAGALGRMDRPVDVRWVDEPPWNPGAPGDRAPRQRLWLRTDGRLDDDPLLHACVLAFASDLALLGTALLPHGTT